MNHRLLLDHTAYRELLFKIFLEVNVKIIEDYNILVQNRFFYYPEFIWAFLSSHMGPIFNLKSPSIRV